jgi:predicted secreted protein
MAVDTLGTILSLGIGETPVYTPIANIFKMDFPELSRKTNITSDMASPGWEEKRPGIRDAGKMKATLRFDPKDASHITLLQTFNTNDLYPWKIIFPDHAVEASRTTWTCTGFLKSFKPKGEYDGLIEADCEIEFSGNPNLGTAMEAALA